RHGAADKDPNLALRSRVLERARRFGDAVGEPGGRLDVAVPQKMPAETFARLQRVLVVAATYAYLVVAHEGGCDMAHNHATASPRAEEDAAADGAGIAGGRRPLLLLRHPFVRVLHERRGRAHVDAGAREVAVAFVDRPTRAERDHRVPPTTA